MHKAQLYTTANVVQRRDAAAVLAKYRDRMTWPRHCDVLDVGCGSGDVTCNLLLPQLRSCRSLVGVDVSPAMVSFAAANHQHPQINFRCLDIVATERPRNYFPHGFQKIFSFYCLHWVSDQRRAMMNMYELLEPNGELLLVFLAQNPIFTAYERLAAGNKWGKYMQDDVHRFISPYHHSAEPHLELRNYLETVGFRVEDCECLEQSFTFPSPHLLKSAAKAVNPFLERIPSYLHDEYLNDCVNEIEVF
ncbi:hypothetical protein B566_EDAN010743, partial [Ephemera danica]